MATLALGALASFACASGCSSRSDAVGKKSGANGSGGKSAVDFGNATGTSGSLAINRGDASLGTGTQGACQRLQCQQMSCANGAKTTVSGTVYDPSGTLPLYNVMVYVPNAPLAPIRHGATCGCDISGQPIASTLTDTNGRFVMDNVPVGADIPIVIQVGKWRRQLTLPMVSACADNPIADPGTTRLPAKRSEGDMPRIALTTGNADALECLLRKIGIDDSEFTPESGDGSVNFFAGAGGTNSYDSSIANGATFTAAPTFWDSVTTLESYDVVLLSCEGIENQTNKSKQALQAMQDYANAGGRIFASHWHNYWFEFGPQPFPTIATFHHQADLNDITADIDTSFAKGMALAQWLVNVGGSSTLGKIAIKAAQHTVDAANPAVAQRWIHLDSATSVQYLSTNTPFAVPDAQQCGRVVLSDIHVSSGDKSDPSKPYPTGCMTKDLSPQEKALVFMLFDISACLTPDDKPPQPPAIVQ